MIPSIMEQETKQTPELIEKQLILNHPITTRIGAKLRQLDPCVVVFIGRGSSDHAGVFGKYLIEIEAGIPVSPSSPSVSSVYFKKMNLKRAVIIVISQSGRSPDVLTQVRMARSCGAYTIALINDETSPLANLVDEVLPIRAEKEIAVAATKSYLCTLSALIQLTAHWTQNSLLLRELSKLPNALKKINSQTAQLKSKDLKAVSSLIILGRGFGFAVAKEMALKLKEICSIHAEAFSSAEFLHGPIALIQHDVALLNACVHDESLSIHQVRIRELESKGVHLLHLSPINTDIHPRLSSLLLMQRFYLDIAKAAVKLGFDPDAPEGLKKITKTL
ncbi:glucosamine-6-phosphate deaminase NagB-II [Shewanella surugensis]|uniref:SIS domain-containing protein n=1 Tax=Shewanella surugensis TaxID=212020 RepID=A0ABT0LE49_9GAMM|nr:SIS domain-containing protein [Shewanella surugensis]MCL1125605.1 SIS domain-containing protein [Shewanella surugensis]